MAGNEQVIRIYHNPSCKKSRAGLQFLRDSGKEFRVIEYLKDRLTEAELEALLVKLNMGPGELLRTQEDYFKTHLKGKHFLDHELVRIMVENPKLIRRPLVESRYRAVIGDPAGNIAILLDS